MVWRNCAYQPVGWVRAQRHNCRPVASVTDTSAGSACACTLKTCLLFKRKVLRHGCCSRPASLVKLLQKKNCLVLDICAGPVPHNQTCVLVDMSTDPLAMMDGLLV